MRVKSAVERLCSTTIGYSMRPAGPSFGRELGAPFARTPCTYSPRLSVSNVPCGLHKGSRWRQVLPPSCKHSSSAVLWSTRYGTSRRRLGASENYFSKKNQALHANGKRVSLKQANAVGTDNSKQ